MPETERNHPPALLTCTFTLRRKSTAPGREGVRVPGGCPAGVRVDLARLVVTLSQLYRFCQLVLASALLPEANHDLQLDSYTPLWSALRTKVHLTRVWVSTIAAVSSGIFISYRRKDTNHFAGRLADRLIGRFGAEQVFIDVETLRPGADFAQAIDDALESCAVLVAVIGPDWLSMSDGRGRRIDDPDDFVRLEIGKALAREIRVIPVLVEGTAMPPRSDLPSVLADLTRLHAFSMRYETFHRDAGRLAESIEQELAPQITVDRLLSDAESIATTITDEIHQSAALWGIAGIAATTDPDRAVHITNTITRDGAKQCALCDVAIAAAAADPDRAMRIANNITHDALRDFALLSMAKAVAVADPDRAVRTLNTIISQQQKTRAMADVAAVIAATDPDRAARLLGDAERIASTITSESDKARALADVAGAVAATDPGRAARLLGDAERIASTITSEWQREAGLREVAGAVAATDPDRAERIANTITSESDKARALCYVVSAISTTDPDRATRLLSDAQRIANTITIRIERDHALCRIARAAAATDPSRASDIADTITEHAEKAYALIRIAQTIKPSPQPLWEWAQGPF